MSRHSSRRERNEGMTRRADAWRADDFSPGVACRILAVDCRRRVLVWTSSEKPGGLRRARSLFFPARPGFRPVYRKILANLLHLGLFHDLPPAGGSCSNFRPELVEGRVRRLGPDGPCSGGQVHWWPAHFSRTRDVEKTTNHYPASTECQRNIHLWRAKVLNSPSFMRRGVALCRLHGYTIIAIKHGT